MVVALLVISMVSASNLQFKEIKAYVNGDKESGISRTGGTIDAEPDSRIKLKVEVENTYAESTDRTIEDVFVTAEFELEDQEFESDDDDVDAGDDQRFTFYFDVPLVVEEDDFDLDLILEGEDNNTKLKEKVTLKVEVDKKNHKLNIRTAEIKPETVDCERAVNMEVEVLNIGAKDEEEVELSISNDALGMDFTTTFELEEGVESNSMKKINQFFEISDDVRIGSYPVDISAKYGNYEEERQLFLAVEKCEEEEPEEVIVVEDEPEEETEEEDDFEAELLATEDEESFTESNTYLYLIIGAEVLIVLIIVALILTFRKKK